MPRIKSSIKDVRKNRVQREINRSGKSTLKTLLRKARATAGDDRKAVIQNAYHVIDKASQNGLIHKNTAARYKSNLARTKKAAA